jgi:nitrogen-specific signal transduction histidine kinase
MVHERTRELKEAQAALVQREKLKTLGATAAEVAHEIRNPLVSIGGFARRLQKKYPESPETEIIVQETERLESMLGRLRDYLRPVDMKPRECHVNAILTDSVALLALELEKDKVKIHLDLYPDLPMAHVDPALLTKVFVAMIRNAVGMMDMEKEITVKTYYGEHSIYVDMISPVAGTPSLCFCHSKRVAKGPGFPRHLSSLRKWAARCLFPNTTQRPNLRFRSLNAMKPCTVK